MGGFQSKQLVWIGNVGWDMTALKNHKFFKLLLKMDAVGGGGFAIKVKDPATLKSKFVDRILESTAQSTVQKITETTEARYARLWKEALNRGDVIQLAFGNDIMVVDLDLVKSFKFTDLGQRHEELWELTPAQEFIWFQGMAESRKAFRSNDFKPNFEPAQSDMVYHFNIGMRMELPSVPDDPDAMNALILLTTKEQQWKFNSKTGSFTTSYDNKRFPLFVRHALPDPTGRRRTVLFLLDTSTHGVVGWAHNLGRFYVAPHANYAVWSFDWHNDVEPDQMTAIGTPKTIKKSFMIDMLKAVNPSILTILCFDGSSLILPAYRENARLLKDAFGESRFMYCPYAATGDTELARMFDNKVKARNVNSFVEGLGKLLDKTILFL